MLKIGNKKISEKIIFRDTVLEKGTGLMFRKKPVNQAYIFRFNKPTKISVTMFFVFYPIDLIFLDENKKIIELKESLKPFTNYVPKKKATTLIELNSGEIKKNKIKIGQKASF